MAKNYQDHYDNSKGSLYKIADDLGLNSWEYDVFKHLVRCRKKGEWISDIEKCINILKLYKEENSHLYKNQVEKINK